jgi:AcrR family transcriptional regulator
MVFYDPNHSVNFFKKDPASWTTRERILEAAIHLFAAQGFDGVSVRQIAKKVGIHESSLYNHFRSKDEILESIFAIYKTELLEAVATPETEIDELLKRFTPEEIWQSGFTRWREQMGTPEMMMINRITALEQYRNPMIRSFVLKSIVEGPVDYLEKLFSKLISYNLVRNFEPRQLAQEFQSYTTALVFEYNVLRYDSNFETQVSKMDEIEEKMRAHIRFFWELVKQ